MNLRSPVLAALLGGAQAQSLADLQKDKEVLFKDSFTGRREADVRAQEQMVHDELGRHFAGDARAALRHCDHGVEQDRR